MKRSSDEKMNNFVNRIEKAASIAKRLKMELPTKFKGLKLLNDAGLSDQDIKLVLTEANFNKEEEVYSAAKIGPAKYINSEGTATNPAIKVDPKLTAHLDETLVASGCNKPIVSL